MFGRRKPGFAVEVDKKILENESNEINVDKFEEELKEKIDFIDFLNEGEPEYLDDLENLEDLDELEDLIDVSELEDNRTKYQLLADYIRERSRGAKLTSLKSLLEEDGEVEETLRVIESEEDTQDITFKEGDLDHYYYSNRYMSDNYAMIAVLVEEKDLVKTIAEMVRWNCKTYPCPTPFYYFKNTPYCYKDEEIQLALENLKNDERYKDIEELVTGNNVRYFYSTLHMSQKYARALAESAEQ